MKSYTSGYFNFNDAIFLISNLKVKLPKISLIVGFGVFTGLRIGDILNLRWFQILNVDFILLPEQKTSKVRHITLNPVLKSLILSSYDSFGTCNLDFVFLNRYNSKVISLQYVNSSLRKACKDFNICCSGNISSHSLRKTFGRRVYENLGKTDEALMILSSIFNHSCPSITRIYLGIKQEEIAEIYLNL
ncbi:tyrosine-type recombinase/integrase [Polaribacter vadi]|uniref:tyrosine-type recombinase/integrase n=1 Tax=Polaribacter TaxID=52959 RepID=UPI001C09359C|nr:MULTISPECIES: tyrosine-type recombinase/integrase [Polaribacter]MBU3010181.1 tyrosine-type recombinase/integrase [Polaribacter vadi]MDO6739988.1 tyrosine-type recombinase/integrase [Polaribacter sp. 1_MG-2023]